MKKLLLFIAITFSMSLNAQEGIRDTWKYGLDKQIHENVGFGFGVTSTSLMLNSDLGYSYFDAIAGPFVISAFPIGTKEWYDHSFKPNGFASEQDMIWGFYGTLEGSGSTAGTYALSEWMLSKKIYGSRDSYKVPVFTSGLFYFSTEMGKWTLIDGYRISWMNIFIKTAIQGVNMLIKYNKDKKAGRLELENFKL